MKRPVRFDRDVLTALSQIRPQLVALCGRADRAEELMQETVLLAFEHHRQFRRGTNLHGWLYAIARNAFRSSLRKARREQEDPGGLLAGTLIQPAAQEHRVHLQKCLSAFDEFSPAVREPFVQVAVLGHGYDQVATALNIPAGTVKSRVHRMRRELVQRFRAA